jgi:hypothetical protein
MKSSLIGPWLSAPPHRAAGGPHRHPQQGGEEQQADEAAHERAAAGAGTGAAGLVDLDPAVGVAGDDDDVVELEDLLLRHLDQLVANLLGGRAIRIRNRDQIAHLALLGVSSGRVLRRLPVTKASEW